MKRSILILAVLLVLISLGGCCQPQVVGEKEMAGLIESQAALFGWLETYIDADPALSDAEKTIRKGEIQAVEEASAKYLQLLQNETVRRAADRR